MFKQFRNFLALLILVFVGACSSSSNNFSTTDPDPDENDKTEKLIILHVNDVHANINNFGKIAAYVDQVRSENENVLLVSAGDLFSGDPVVDQYDQPGFPIIHLMNELKFDLAVLGNHEFDYGQNNLNDRIAQASFPFICANVDASNATLNQPDPFKKFTTKGGFEVFFLGMVETSTKINGKYIPSTHPDKVNGIFFPYYKTEIGKYTQYKKKDNLFVLLSHLGLGADEKMASMYSELDIVIGGHSHSVVDKPYTENNALICQAGSRGRFIGQIEITIEEGKVKSKSAKLVNVENLSKTKSEIESIIEVYNNNPVLERVIAFNESNLDTKDELGSLMCDATNWKVQSAMCFQNSGGIRSRLYQGDIKVKDVYQLDPFNNEVIVFTLSYNEILSLLGSSSNGDLKVAGINIRYGGSQPRLEDYDGNQLDENTTYKVAMSSYIASAYDFNHSDAGQNMNVTTSNCLIEFLEHKKTINYEGVTHIYY